MADVASKDGFYFKRLDGRTYGPLTAQRFEYLRNAGYVQPGMKAWRQVAGAIYTVSLA